MLHEQEHPSDRPSPQETGNVSPAFAVINRIIAGQQKAAQQVRKSPEFLGAVTSETQGTQRSLVLPLRGKRDNDTDPSARILEDISEPNGITDLRAALQTIAHGEPHGLYVIDCTDLGQNGSICEGGIAVLVGFWKDLGYPQGAIVLRNPPAPLLASLRTKQLLPRIFALESPETDAAAQKHAEA